MTAQQTRDKALRDFVPTTETAQMMHVMAIECEEARRHYDDFVQCPRCRGYHSVHGNFDKLCDSCCETLLRHFPDHEAGIQLRKKRCVTC